ncbi:BON domain-containing protein [Candidatus Enterovibrio altilux]|nr:BON domain-containing protein [Candidatus Enterovibrio luxaltus]
MTQRILLVMSIFMLSACSLIDKQDTRTAKREWMDTQHSMEIAGIINKATFKNDARVNAAIYNGKVLLVGQASKTFSKQSLVDKIRGIKGVVIVYDQIRIKQPLSLAGVSEDTWLTTKVKLALIGSKKLKEASVKVITEDSEVFLLGYVTLEQGNEATEITRNLSGVKQVIKGFHYVE